MPVAPVAVENGIAIEWPPAGFGGKGGTRSPKLLPVVRRKTRGNLLLRLVQGWGLARSNLFGEFRGGKVAVSKLFVECEGAKEEINSANRIEAGASQARRRRRRRTEKAQQLRLRPQPHGIIQQSAAAAAAMALTTSKPPSGIEHSQFQCPFTARKHSLGLVEALYYLPYIHQRLQGGDIVETTGAAVQRRRGPQARIEYIPQAAEQC